MSMSDLLQRGPADKQHNPSLAVRDLLESARRHLGMDVAFLGEFVDDREVYRALAGDGSSFGLAEGAALPLADTYCQAMIDGRIDNVVADSAAEPAVADLAVTSAGRIGSYIGVPVRLPDGHLYGALCGLGHHADPTLRQRDANLLEFLADRVADELAREEQASKRRRQLVASVTPLLDGSGLTMVFQPIVDLCGGTIAGYEALARFCAEPARGPDAWFDDAAEVGLGVDLELTGRHRRGAGSARAHPGRDLPERQRLGRDGLLGRALRAARPSGPVARDTRDHRTFGRGQLRRSRQHPVPYSLGGSAPGGR